MAGWAFQCLQLEPQWEPVSLGLYIELPRESEWRIERQDPLTLIIPEAQLSTTLQKQLALSAWILVGPSSASTAT